jgi:hypothetical protein
MFSYDRVLAKAVETAPRSVDDVLEIMHAIDAACSDSDGLKWFNWLYLQVTTAVEKRIETGGFANPSWLAELDVQFAQLYFNALSNALASATCPGCWSILFKARDQDRIARIQFALAGINAHINHDLPAAIVATCKVTGTIPRHETPEYSDYIDLNSTLDSQIDLAKKTLNVRLLGGSLPPVSYLEDLLAGWGTAAAREKAWNNAEVLWHLQDVPSIAAGFEDSLDGLATFAGKSVLIAVA